MAIRFFKYSSLNQSASKEEPFSKILFYSVIAHYIIFYFLFGNPFLILTQQEGGSLNNKHLNVQLLSPGQVDPGPGIEVAQGKFDFPAFPPEEGSDGSDEPPSDEKEAAPSEEGIKAIKSIEPAPPTVTKKVVRKLPRNMTGPEDCMLKVVAMVCPNGDPECIAEYREFCMSL